MHALAGKDAVVARRLHPVLRRARFLPEEVGELHQEYFAGIDLFCRGDLSTVGDRMVRVDAQAEIGAVGVLDDFPRLRPEIDVPPPGKRLVGDADAERQGEHGEFLQVLLQQLGLAGRVRRIGGASEQHPRAERAAHLEHALRDVDLVGMQVAREAFEVAQHLESGDAQPARAHRGDCRRLAVGMADDIGRVQHYLREAARLDGTELRLQRSGRRDRVHPEMIQVHLLTTSSKVTPPRYTWVSAPLSLGCTEPRSMKTTPRSLSALVAAGMSGAPRPTRTSPSSQWISSDPA